ncbi:hypothetical protein [Bacillus sp. CECT 9360]|uniref:hypothetical protein n=1 Tax=Bacillus sp. CECT 9360 TaxID=2845821 RepID=UPI001E51EE5A|nr:hypothetical protein [Bacillus sp. CECT 9360]CAH0344185.1 hypothetical protein BCI9360_00427 [Bacillus sp. CECT 9360]
MNEEKEPNVLRDTAKSFLKSFTWGSVFHPEMSPEKTEKTREFSTKEVANHLTGREKLSDEDVEQLKRAAKYMP